MRLLVQPRMAGSSPVITRILLLTASHRFHNLTTPVGPGSFSAMLLSHASQPFTYLHEDLRTYLCPLTLACRSCLLCVVRGQPFAPC